MFVNVFAAASTAPIATLTYTINGRKYLKSFRDGDIVGRAKDGCRVCIVDQFPKLITPTGEAFLINGKKVSAGGFEYEVSGVKIHKLCYMVNPGRNQSLRAALDEVQAELQNEANACWKDLNKYIDYFRANRAPVNGDPEYVHIMTELRKLCSRKCFPFKLTKSETKKAIDTLEKMFSEHAILEDTEEILAAANLFVLYRDYMAIVETRRANMAMKQKPLFELLNKDITFTATQKVYEGERFTVNCGSEELTAHSVRGVPVVKAADGSLQMVMEGGYLKVATGRGSLYAPCNSGSDEPVRRMALYYVSDVNTPMGISYVCCDEDEFVKLSMNAHQSVIDRYSDEYEEVRMNLIENLVSAHEMVDGNRVNLKSSNLLPSARLIYMFALFYGPAAVDSEELMLHLAERHDDLQRESRGTITGDNLLPSILGYKAHAFNTIVQALRKAEAHAAAARSATV